MKFPYFTGQRTKPLPKSDGEKLPPSTYFEESKPEGYLAGPDLVDAVNVALLMGKPLLLTGEPGTGKTQLASRVAWELGELKLLKFETKSTTKASDLFYYFNTVGYFQAAQTKKDLPVKEFITYNALGEAIIRTLPASGMKDYLPQEFLHDREERVVVLIDEIDKAPRDFPNDILNELEGLYFKIPELSNQKFTANPNLAPIVIITSNSEKSLPDPFLRRCVFYHIPFPERKEDLAAIIRERLYDNLPEEEVLEKLLSFFLAIRQEGGLKKKPSTNELILWIKAVNSLLNKKSTATDLSSRMKQTLGLLIKTQSDLDIAKKLV